MHGMTRPDWQPVDWDARARAIAEAIADNAEAHDSDDSFVAESFALLKQEGFLAALVPLELGGGGASIREIAAAIRIIGAACGSTALAFSMHSHQVAAAAWRWRHQQAPTDGLLRRVAGEKLVLVSSGGSDWLASGGSAVAVEGGWRVTAQKPFASGAPAGSLLLTSARVEAAAGRDAEVIHFALPLDAPGVRIEANWRALGMRGSGSHLVHIEGAFVPEAGVSGRRPADRWHPLFHIIAKIAFALIYAAYVGVADGARQRALAIVKARPVDQLRVEEVGRMETSFGMAEMVLEHMLALAEEAAPGPETTNRAMVGRTLVARAVLDTLDAAMDLVGGAAFHRATGLERAFRDAQGARFHPLREPEQARYAGRMALGLDMDGT